jgi:hypothetical protein
VPRPATGDELLRKLYDGLQEIAQNQFPRHCGACGRTFRDADEFIRSTHALRNLKNEHVSALQAAEDEHGQPAIQLYRNCPCGSTMLEFFQDRRDLSPAGQQRRKRFGELLEQMEQSGIDRALGRVELIRFLRGEESALIRGYIDRLKSEGDGGGG